MSDLQVIDTADGSSSLLHTALNEPYHSTHGAVQESAHVFIKSGLQFFQLRTQAQSVSIFEVGFGNGLNALLALIFAEQNQVHVNYTTIEARPLDWPLLAQLNYPHLLEDGSWGPSFHQLHHSQWEESVAITQHFSLKKIQGSLLDSTIGLRAYDLIFFDAFAPAKQPEMWTYPVLKKIATAMKPGGMLVTYCAKGQVKRDLKALNLTVESIPGPPGKREMVRARKAQPAV